MKEVIQSIVAKLGSLIDLKYVDEDWGQLDYYSQNFPVKFPCVLVDISSANFQNLGLDKTASPMQRQTSETTVSLTIANVKLSNTSHNAPQGQKDDGDSIWVLLETIHKVLQGWNPTDKSGKLIRVGMQRIKRDDGVQEYTIIYTAGMQNV